MAGADHTGLPRVGQTLGSYELLAILGRGGMGQVYAARDTLLEREVALKVLWRGDADTLVREGRALAAIDHESVVRVYGIDVSGPRPFVAMERIHGGSLADVLEETPRLQRDRALRVLRGVAAGLDAIHAAGRVHGDVKPENVLIERGTGRIKLTDLGLSRAIARSGSSRGGTPAYMAPERARGDRPSPELLPREDIYSLAVMAFELLTGRLPFDSSDTYELLRQHAMTSPPRASAAVLGLSWRVDHVLAVGLAKRPEERDATAMGFVDRLVRAVRLRSGPRILVVDDDAALARMLSMRLAKRLPQASVRTVTCARTALELIGRERPDALITDVEMPDMNGLELLGSLRHDPAAATMPRVVLSGRATPADFAIFGRLGAARCFSKPVDVDGLATFLADTLHLDTAPPKVSGVIRRIQERAATQPDSRLRCAGGEEE